MVDKGEMGQYFGFLLSVSFHQRSILLSVSSFHECSILIFIYMSLDTEWQMDEVWEPANTGYSGQHNMQ
jgi:hypothetical protein